MPTPLPLPENGIISSELDLEHFKLGFEIWSLPTSLPLHMEISTQDWT